MGIKNEVEGTKPFCSNTASSMLYPSPPLPPRKFWRQELSRKFLKVIVTMFHWISTRHRAAIKRTQDPRMSSTTPPVPPVETERTARERIPSTCDPKLVFFCRQIYDYRMGRILKNPLYVWSQFKVGIITFGHAGKHCNFNIVSLACVPIVRWRRQPDNLVILCEKYFCV
jgi:hypothetical protein